MDAIAATRSRTAAAVPSRITIVFDLTTPHPFLAGDLRWFFDAVSVVGDTSLPAGLRSVWPARLPGNASTSTRLKTFLVQCRFGPPTTGSCMQLVPVKGEAPYMSYSNSLIE
jgi:hypothetical protein